MKSTIVLIAAIFAALLTGCQPKSTSVIPVTTTETGLQEVLPEKSDEQRARDAAKEMLALAEKGDWGAYVDGFYGESHKFRSSADRDELVRRFEVKYAGRVLEALRGVVELPISIIDDHADFTDGDEVKVQLHRSEDGRWTFHL